jgi:hypothetical protein
MLTKRKDKLATKARTQTAINIIRQPPDFGQGHTLIVTNISEAPLLKRKSRFVSSMPNYTA